MKQRINAEHITETFLGYTLINTTSVPSSPDLPSCDNQYRLAQLVAGEFSEVSSIRTDIRENAIMLGALAGPYFKHRGCHYKSWMFITSIFMVVTTFAMLFADSDIVILVCSFLTGALFATWFAFIFSIPKEGLKEATTQTVTSAMSTFWFCTFIIATINSQLIGWSVDITGGFTTGFTYVFALMIISPLVALFVFPKPPRNAEECH